MYVQYNIVAVQGRWKGGFSCVNTTPFQELNYFFNFFVPIGCYKKFLNFL